MGHIVNKGPSESVSVRTIHSTNEERKKDFKDFKERKDQESKIKDDRFAKFEERRKPSGGGKGINIDTLKEDL